MVETVAAHSGVSNTREAMPPRVAPIPRPKRAVSRGRPMASADPKASSRMKAANTRPMNSEPGFTSATRLVTSISTPPLTPGSTAARNFLANCASSLNSLSSVRSKFTSANATLPSWEICEAPSWEYGLCTPLTWRCLPAVAMASSALALTAGSLMSPAKTSLTESP